MPHEFLNASHVPVPDTSIPSSYTHGESLNWKAPWMDVTVSTELPFWLMLDDTEFAINCQGHDFPVSVHGDYFELIIGEVSDSRSYVLYRGPLKRPEHLSDPIRNLMEQRPDLTYIWRKCKTCLKIRSRCNADVWSALMGEADRRNREATTYISELCRAHIPVINQVIQAYRLATYDHFPFEVAPWDVSYWIIDHEGHGTFTNLVNYRMWDRKPLLYGSDPQNAENPKVYSLITPQDFKNQLSASAAPGEFELLDALNLMERGDYSGAVRRVTTAIEVIVEAVLRKALEEAEGKGAAKEFLRSTRMRFDERIKKFQQLTGRTLPEVLRQTLKESRDLRQVIVHGGYRINFSERGKAQKSVDTCRFIFNWFENDQNRRDIREKRIALRSLGKDSIAGVFQPKITPEGVLLSHHSGPKASR